MRSALAAWSSEHLKRLVSMRMRRRISRHRVAVRQLTARFRMLPNALIIGGQRCGTSSLFKYLGRHPEVESSIRKETQYFTAFTHRGEPWYRAHFPLVGPFARRRPRICFEATPDYLLDPRCPARAAAALGRAYIVVLLRNPIERAFSHYQHNRSLGLERLSFEAALDAEDVRLAPHQAMLDRHDDLPLPKEYCRYSYVTRGLYAERLPAWIERFSRDRLLILCSEELFANPAGAYATVTSFLGISPWRPTEFRNHSHVTSPGVLAPTPMLAAATRARLARQFREPNERLYDLVGRRFDW